MNLDNFTPSQKIEFKSEFQKSLTTVSTAYNWMINLIRNFLNPFELTPQQYFVLRIIKRSHPEPLTLQQIRENLVDKTDVSRIIDRIIQKDLVEKTPHPKDKRASQIRLTQKGELLLNMIYGDLEQLEEVLLANEVTLEDLKQINRQLEKLR